MANVAEIVDGDPTDIHPHLFFMEREEVFLFATQSVVDTKSHKFTSKCQMSKFKCQIKSKVQKSKIFCLPQAGSLGFDIHLTFGF
jgi:hypothetical protein